MKCIALTTLLSAVLASVRAEDNVLDIIHKEPTLSTLAQLLKNSGLDATLTKAGPFTIFAPENTAFSTAPMADYKIAYLGAEEHKSSLASLLKYHVIVGSELDSGDLSKVGSVSTSQGSVIAVHADSNKTLHLVDETCTDARVERADVKASNGVVHITSGVFVPKGAFCPDLLFTAEQRVDGRIMEYGYDCRAKGTKTRSSGETKPVGLSASSTSGELFWSNDYDYPSASKSSWISSLPLKKLNSSKILENVVDPQGVDVVDEVDSIFFASHLGNAVMRSFKNGSNLTAIVEKRGDLDFQPADVAVDYDEDLMAVTVEDKQQVNGSLWTFAVNGSNPKILKTGLIRNFGLCLDKFAKKIYYVQGGNDGSISCVRYNGTACEQEQVATGLLWPYMCDVDNAFSRFGGPTYIAFSEANLPGSVSYIRDDGSEKLNVVTNDLMAPMGLQFGCSRD